MFYVPCPYLEKRTALVRVFPIGTHKTWSHSCMGEFVHEAYHYQGLLEYDRDQVLRKDTNLSELLGCFERVCHVNVAYSRL
jgi:hypothetical protein